MITLVPFISPYRKDRDQVTRLRQRAKFVEVYMKIPLEVCEQRRPQGAVQGCEGGKIKGFTGIDDLHEEPLDAEIVMRLRRRAAIGPWRRREDSMLPSSRSEQKGFLREWEAKESARGDLAELPTIVPRTSRAVLLEPNALGRDHSSPNKSKSVSAPT